MRVETNSQFLTLNCPLSPVPAGYKRTEVGVIPVGWEIAGIGFLADKVGSGITPRGGNQNYRSSGRPFVRSQNVSWGVMDLSDIVYIDDEVHQTFQSTELREGDVLLNITGASIGRSAVADKGVEGGNVNQHVCIIRLRPSYSSLFLNAALISRIGQKQIDSFQAGGNREGLNFQQVRSINIPLPPTKAEQEAIAEALSDADAWIASLEQLIQKKRQIKQGAMQSLLTGKRRLPGFCGKWEEKTVQELGEVGRGRVISHREITRSFDPRYPVYSSQTSDDGIMGYLDSHDFEGNYITWTTDGANAGTVFARSGRFNCTNVCGTIKPHHVDYRFLAGALGRVAKNHVSKHLGNPKLMNDVMKKIAVNVAPSLSEQTAIAAVLSDVDVEIDALETKLAKARQIKQGMMQELLTGRKRLI